jgi:gamma-glutamyltranspeptidase / glutathione hydrolase
MVATQLGIVAASQPLAARAGVAILERGGSAADAAIAANAAIGLMEPSGSGIGGDLFVLYYEAKSGKTYGLNSSGWSPSGLSATVVRSDGHGTMPQRGIHTVTTPGVVAGWDALHKRFGAIAFPQLFKPAIYYAEHGFPVSEVIAAHWKASDAMLSEHPNSAKTFLIDGRAPKPGDLFRNPDLARSLQRIAEKGRDGFYTGPIADAIVQISKEEGGRFTAADLAEFEPEWIEPIRTTYRGWTVSELPPNGIGIAALMMLNIMEQYPLGEFGFHSAKSLHVMIEAKKLAFADMIRYIGDPRHSSIPVEPLLSKTHGAERAKLINLNKAAGHVLPAQLDGITNARGADTIYLSVVDRDGNIASLIQSNYLGFGSGLVPPGTGFMLHCRGALFTLEPHHPNTLAPRKRPLHTIIPAFMEKDGVRIGFGIMGGFNQPQAHAQFVANIADYGLTIQEALEAGRFTKPTFDGWDVSIESLIPTRVITELGTLGHDVTIEPPRSSLFGYGQAVMASPDGVHFGASEPRHDGAAIPEMPSVF